MPKAEKIERVAEPKAGIEVPTPCCSPSTAV